MLCCPIKPYLSGSLAECIHPPSYFCSGNWIGLFCLHQLWVVGPLLLLQEAQSQQRPKDCPFNPSAFNPGPTLTVSWFQCNLHVSFLYLHILSTKEMKILPTYVCLQLSDFVPPSKGVTEIKEERMKRQRKREDKFCVFSFFSHNIYHFFFLTLHNENISCVDLRGKKHVFCTLVSLRILRLPLEMVSIW